MRPWIHVVVAFGLSPAIVSSAPFSPKPTVPFPTPLSIPSQTTILVPGLDPRLGVLEGFYVEGRFSWEIDATFTSRISEPWDLLVHWRLVSWLEFARVFDTINDWNFGTIQPGESISFHIVQDSASEPEASRVEDPRTLRKFNTANLVPLNFDTGELEIYDIANIAELTDFSARVTGGTVTMFYEYREAQVPEPATPLLFSLGLIGTLLLRKLNRRKHRLESVA